MSRPTDDSGQYRMQLTPGRYGIAVQYGTDVKSEVQEIEIEIEAGEPVSLDFVLDVDG